MHRNIRYRLILAPIAADCGAERMLVLFRDQATKVALAPGCAGSGLRDAIWTAVCQQVVNEQTVAVRLRSVGRILVPAAGVRLQVSVRVDRIQSVLQPGEVVWGRVDSFNEGELVTWHLGMRIIVPAAFFPSPLVVKGGAFMFEGVGGGPWRVGDVLPLSVLRVEEDGVAVAKAPARLLMSHEKDSGTKRKFSA